MEKKEDKAIAIIGGDDGPTSIFVASSPRLWVILAIALFVILLITAVILIIKHKRK